MLNVFFSKMDITPTGTKRPNETTENDGTHKHLKRESITDVRRQLEMIQNENIGKSNMYIC